MFGRLGAWCHDHRRIVVIGWILTIFVAGGIMSSVGTAYQAEFNLPNVESRRASTSSRSTSAARAPA